MRIETCRMLSDWLLQPEPVGINHWIPLVPKDASDPTPPLIAAWKNTLAVFNETDPNHPWVTEKKDPPVTPAIYIMSEGEFEVAGDATPDGQVRDTENPAVIVARYINDLSDVTTNLRNGEYTLRAMMRAFRELFRNTYATFRSRNGIELIQLETAIYMPVIETIENARVAGAVVLNINVRDANNTF